MRRIFYGFLYLLLCSTILIISCANEPRYYIALGDSVSAGYGLTAPDNSHPSKFFAMLKDEGYVDDYVNMAADGFTTAMLLNFLNNMENEKLRIFRNTRIITLNIGGNNILHPFSNYLANLGFASGADTIRAGVGDIAAGARGVFSGVGNILPESDLDTLVITDVISGLGDIVAGTRSIITGSGEIISSSLNVFSTFAGSFSPELRAELDNALQIFSDEFIEIIAWLESNAPRATIIVNTVYNPIPQEILGASLEIANATNTLIESINKIIIQKSESREYLVTDVHSHLSNQLSLMNFNLNPFARDISFDIVHPNAEGHGLIAQLNFDTFMQR